MYTFTSLTYRREKKKPQNILGNLFSTVGSLHGFKHTNRTYFLIYHILPGSKNPSCWL